MAPPPTIAGGRSTAAHAGRGDAPRPRSSVQPRGGRPARLGRHRGPCPTLAASVSVDTWALPEAGRISASEQATRDRSCAEQSPRSPARLARSVRVIEAGTPRIDPSLSKRDASAGSSITRGEGHGAGCDTTRSPSESRRLGAAGWGCAYGRTADIPSRNGPRSPCAATRTPSQASSNGRATAQEELLIRVRVIDRRPAAPQPRDHRRSSTGPPAQLPPRRPRSAVHRGPATRCALAVILPRNSTASPNTPALAPEPGGYEHCQYHLPRAKPPKAIKPTTTMISPIQKLQTIISTMPTMTMIPPVEIPAIPPRFSRSAMRCSFMPDDAASATPRWSGARRRMVLHRPSSIRLLAAAFYRAHPDERYQRDRGSDESVHRQPDRNPDGGERDPQRRRTKAESHGTTSAIRA
jgi:hypothetical protein